MSKTFLVTGGTGFIGSQLIPLLKADGHKVVVLTTGNRKEHLGAPCFKWSLESQEMDEKALEGVTDIINLAGATINKKWTPYYKQEIVDSRTQGPPVLLKYLERRNQTLNSFISASGISIYPDSQELANEESTHAQSFIAEVCEQWERAADIMQPVAKRVVKFRIGLVLHPDQGALEPILKVSKLGIAAPLGSGHQYMSWISADDLTRLLYWGTEHKIEGVFNAVAPNPETNTEFMRKTAKAVGRPFFLPKVPAFALKLVMGEMATLVLTSIRVSSAKITSRGFTFEHENLSETLNHLLKK